VRALVQAALVVRLARLVRLVQVVLLAVTVPASVKQLQRPHRA